ncbi:MAG: DNA polymerase/3'-5' exonuclease PolX [Candidatus Latescibacterota bacterium]|nr:MAG: DNA polymerase/3'-5' exonuclease PolX [Candidatus Latescibacterota bacterium]
MKNRELSEIFGRMADILEFKGENPFKVNAYRKASRVIGELRDDVEVIYKQGRLMNIPGIGSGIAKKIEEYLTTGRMSKYEEISRGVPEGLMELMAIQSMGPKTLALLHDRLGVESLDDLKRAIEDGSMEALPGLGAKKVENIKRGIKLYAASRGRIPLGIALPIVEGIIAQLKQMKQIIRISTAGSLRRMKENIGDIDILAAGTEGEQIIHRFAQLPQVTEVLAAGDTKGSVIIEGKTQVDLRVVSPQSFGSALQYFTGSKAHNIHLREIAKGRGLKISEYGIFRGNERLGGQREEDIYSALGLSWIPPEMREDRGEIEAASAGTLPELVKPEEIHGDLHVHSQHSDGTATIEQIALKAEELGYEYIAICDHSQSARYAGGLSEEELLEEIKEIDQLNQKLRGIRILAGTEVDINADGSLDYPDELLAKLDIVVAAVHSGFKKNVTERMISAMENPHVDVIAHPTGRLISSREGYEVDVDQIMAKAAETHTALEINSYYDRLDLSDINCMKAKQMGVKLSIGTDAHHIDQLWAIRLGVAVARRGWLGGNDLLNTLSLPRLLEFLQQPKPQRG